MTLRLFENNRSVGTPRIGARYFEDAASALSVVGAVGLVVSADPPPPPPPPQPPPQPTSAKLTQTAHIGKEAERRHTDRTGPLSGEYKHTGTQLT